MRYQHIIIELDQEWLSTNHHEKLNHDYHDLLSLSEGKLLNWVETIEPNCSLWRKVFNSIGNNL